MGDARELLGQVPTVWHNVAFTSRPLTQFTAVPTAGSMREKEHILHGLEQWIVEVDEVRVAVLHAGPTADA
jgi:hypothetical protein